MSDQPIPRAERRRIERQQRRMREYVEKRLVPIVRREGWAVQSVMADAENPGFSYTVGLTLAGWPELLTYALPPTVSGSLLNNLAGRMVRGELDLEQLPIVLEDLANMPTWLLEADAEEAPVSIARMLFGKVRVVQLIFPDPEGVWPWEENWSLVTIPLHAPVPEAS